jgi:hypothetical protein
MCYGAITKSLSLNKINVKNYFLVYRDKYGFLKSAVPNAEGVYKKDIKFDAFKEVVAPNEVFILETEQKILNDQACYTFLITSKFVAETTIAKAIEIYGFEYFFTSVIKEHITKEFGQI